MACTSYWRRQGWTFAQSVESVAGGLEGEGGAGDVPSDRRNGCDLPGFQTRIRPQAPLQSGLIFEPPIGCALNSGSNRSMERNAEERSPASGAAFGLTVAGLNTRIGTGSPR